MVHVAAGTRAQSAAFLLGELGSEGVAVRSHRSRGTGIRELDELLGGGLRDGELALLAGRPGVGKSVVALQWAHQLARAGGGVVFVGVDQDPTDWVARLLNIELGERLDAAHELSTGLIDELPGRLADVVGGSLRLRDVIDSHPLLADAERAVAAYGDRLLFVGGRGRPVSVNDAANALDLVSGLPVTLFIDYVEKFAGGGRHVEVVVPELVRLAAERPLAVIAVVTVELPAFESSALRLDQLVGAGVLAYEADLILGLTDRSDHLCVQVMKRRGEAAGGSVLLAKDYERSRVLPRPPVP